MPTNHNNLIYISWSPVDTIYYQLHNLMVSKLKIEKHLGALEAIGILVETSNGIK